MRRNISLPAGATVLGLILALLVVPPVSAAGNPFQRGPDPTPASVASSNGGFATARDASVDVVLLGCPHAALEQIADLAAALGEPERSLRLLAASQRFYTDTGIARFPLQADRFDRARSAAQAALDFTDATACWDAGDELSLADAVAYARRGRGERQRPQIGWASLTPAERDVVRLVAEGHTNAEIGQRLFMSVNTVKKHLTHVYAKVEVDGRAGLAAEVARRDL